MLASLAPLPPDEKNFAFEYKWDGVRTIAYIERGGVRLQTRNLIDATQRYPELAALAESLADRRVILDGEIVALDDVDRPSFARLQRRMHLNDAPSIARAVRDVPIFYVIFDLLHLDGRSLLNEPFIHRRELLEELTLLGPCWQVTTCQMGHGGKAMLEAARVLGLEGIIAKRLSSIYEPGRRSAAWIKSKLVQRQEFVIGGWQEQIGEPGKVGALLIGYYQPAKSRRKTGELCYAGRVGSGFDAPTHIELMRTLRSMQTDVNPFATALPRDGTRKYFVRPQLVADVEFRGWTEAGVLRQPAFKGLRTDKQPCEVIRE